MKEISRLEIMTFYSRWVEPAGFLTGNLGNIRNHNHYNFYTLEKESVTTKRTSCKLVMLSIPLSISTSSSYHHPPTARVTVHDFTTRWNLVQRAKCRDLLTETRSVREALLRAKCDHILWNVLRLDEIWYWGSCVPLRPGPVCCM